MRNEFSDLACTTYLGKLFHALTIRTMKELIFVAIYDGNFYKELIIVIGSSSITLSKKESYLFPKLSCSTELRFSRVFQFSKRQRSS